MARDVWTSRAPICTIWCRSGETLGAMLLSEINVAYYQHLMQGMREAIAGGTFETFRKQTRVGWAKGDIPPR